LNSAILYEDNHLIVVNKKPGEIVQGDKTGDEPMSTWIKKYIKDKYKKPGDVFLGTIHRIDRPVSGIVMFARTSKALERMNLQLKERKVSKTYWAVVKNIPEPPSGKLVHYLIKDQAKNKSRAYTVEKPGSLKCILDYETIGRSDKYTLLKITPETGRHHQIRVQLAAIGCPIRGDLKYGSERSNKDGSIHLHARELSFFHPVNQELITITAPPPDELLWNYFSETGK
jgi:23S rRNA pseudouridine1911/1915/1917 synthase